MAHILQYKRVGVEASGEDSTPEAKTIFEQYQTDGKITDYELADSIVKITFATSADCDAYLASMAEINEETNTGANRTEHTRTDT
tara:strand:+ start:282 stop:536 length:255 start_codon:yes stop_codon:yes gene_type:complete